MSNIPVTGNAVRVTWYMCSECSRGFTDVDKMLHHKYKEHPEVLKALLCPKKKVVDTKEKKPRSRTAKVAKPETSKNPRAGAGGRTGAGRPPKALKSTATAKPVNPEVSKSGPPKPPVDINKDNMNTSKPKPASRKRKTESKPTSSTKERKTQESTIHEKTDSSTVKLISSDSQLSNTPAQNKSTELNASGKDADAFRKMFLSSLKMKLQDDKSRTQLLAKSSSPKQPNNSQTSEPKYTCSQCHRTLDSLENLKSHMALHKGIHISSLTGARPTEPMIMPCKLCGKNLTSPPFKCINCPNEKIKFDIPPVQVKREIPDTWAENEYSNPVSMIRSHTAEAIASALRKTLQKSPSPRSNLNRTPNLNGGRVKSSPSNRPKFRSSNGHGSRRTDDTGRRPSIKTITGSPKDTTSSSLSSPRKEVSEKLFECELCQKTFKQESNLVTHKRAHLLENASDSFANSRNFLTTEW